jgi:hypothetical protein
MNPNRGKVRQAFVAELQNQDAECPPHLMTSYVTLLMGLLRAALPPSVALEADRQEQTIAWVVAGIRAPLHPDDEHDAEPLWPAIGDLIEDGGQPRPSRATLRMLARTATRAARDGGAAIPAALVLTAQAIAEIYRAGLL